MTNSSSQRVYCTYFDSGYLARGLTLIESLRQNNDLSTVVVLALDKTTEDFFSKNEIEGVECISIVDIESYEPRLPVLASTRTRMEYVFTTTPILVQFAMDNFSQNQNLVIYLDADLYFFESPDKVVEAVKGASVGIIEHRYANRVGRKLAKYGTYNVGWVGFRNDVSGRRVLDWYAEQTILWCKDKPTDGKYADQGYLNAFPSFPGVKVLENPGFNAAPWNIETNPITSRDSVPVIAADESPLVFFHFHGLHKFGRRYITSELVYGTKLSEDLRKRVYVPYVNHLERTSNTLSNQGFTLKSAKKRGSGVYGLASRFRKTAIDVLSLVTGHAVSTQAQ